MIKVIVFDFDGVIAESVNVKTEAFAEIFKEYPDKVGQIREFHLKNGGMSRFEKFRHIYAKILGKPLSDDEFRRLCIFFSNSVFEKVVASPLVEGVDSFLKYCLGKYPLYVISATPDAEIKEIVRRKELDRYFRRVEGAPRPKAGLLLDVARENNCRSSEVLFIGDSVNDYNAALAAGTRFIARAERSNLEGLDVDLFIRDFRGLEKYLNDGKI